jgi:hypothetical protein
LAMAECGLEPNERVKGGLRIDNKTTPSYLSA